MILLGIHILSGHLVWATCNKAYYILKDFICNLDLLITIILLVTYVVHLQP